MWELIGSSSDTVREDGMVSQAIRFLSVNIKSGSRKDLFNQEGTLQSLCERIVVPSMALRGNRGLMNPRILFLMRALEH